MTEATMRLRCARVLASLALVGCAHQAAPTVATAPQSTTAPTLVIAPHVEAIPVYSASTPLDLGIVFQPVYSATCPGQFLFETVPVYSAALPMVVKP